MLKILLLVAVVQLGSANIVCKDQQGNDVDWFIFYKMPRLNNYDKNDHVANGTGFLYLDSNIKTWSLSSIGMESGEQAIGYTLQQYYSGLFPSTFSIMYNDEFPDSTIWSDDSGHTKGVSQFDRETGYWLIHSIPKFPTNLSSYNYPPNAHYYGQMGICVSLSYNSLGDIAQQLFFNDPFTYQMSLPQSYANDFPILQQVQLGQYQQKSPYTSTKQMKSLGGQPLIHFAKAGGFNRDLYYDLVAPSLQTSLKVETWQHGNTNLFSTCNVGDTSDVLNARHITLPFDLAFDNYYDHSKLAVAFEYSPKNPAVPWVCIGDINRQTHQMVRGGGTMCIRDNSLYTQFSSVISSTYPCNATSNNLYYQYHI